MNRVDRILIALSLCLAIGVVSCGKKPAPAPPPPPPPPPGGDTAAAAAAAAPTAAAAGAAPAPTEDEIFAQKSLDQLNAERPLTDAFFDFDKSDLRDDAIASLQRDAEWMKRWSSTTVTVEGHCDSRGTAEYNIALGERRAKAVKDYLVSLGIAGDRIEVVSKGKESPFCFEENEACWAQNRRGHFIITAK